MQPRGTVTQRERGGLPTKTAPTGVCRSRAPIAREQHQPLQGDAHLAQREGELLAARRPPALAPGRTGVPGDHLGAQDDRTLERVTRGDEAVAGFHAHACLVGPRIAAVAACASPGLVRGGNLAGGLAQALHPLGGIIAFYSGFVITLVVPVLVPAMVALFNLG